MNSINVITISIFKPYFIKSFKFITATFTLSPIKLYSSKYKNIQGLYSTLVYSYTSYSDILSFNAFVLFFLNSTL